MYFYRFCKETLCTNYRSVLNIRREGELERAGEIREREVGDQGNSNHQMAGVPISAYISPATSRGKSLANNFMVSVAIIILNVNMDRQLIKSY